MLVCDKCYQLGGCRPAVIIESGMALCRDHSPTYALLNRLHSTKQPVRTIETMKLKLNRSMTPLHAELRGRLRVSGKFVAATDHDLAIYTLKGTPWLIEFKDFNEVYNKGKVEMSSMQVHNYVQTAGVIKGCTPLVIIVSQREVSQKHLGATVVYGDMSKIRWTRKRGTVTASINQFKRTTLGKLLVIIRAKLQEPSWMQLRGHDQ